VDDEQIIRNVLKRKLEQTTGFTVHTANDGLQALDAFDSQHIDLVISDLLMSEMNGIELLRNLKQRQPDIPVIIITGYGTLDDAIEAIHLGAEDFIKKPFDINEVIETIEKTFRKIAEETDQRRIIKYIADEHVKLVVPTDVDLINLVINFVFSHIKARWLVEDEDLHEVKVCLYEALSNAFEHGNLEIAGTEKVKLLEQSQQAWREFLTARMREEPFCHRQITIKLEISGEEMLVSIEDQGPGFNHAARTSDVNPEALFKSSGRGLILIQSLMDEVNFNESGNLITMRKSRILPASALEA
jgi:YesN/AraC family two-component response regulator